jgi:hypothetical protein
MKPPSLVLHGTNFTVRKSRHIFLPPILFVSHNTPLCLPWFFLSVKCLLIRSGTIFFMTLFLLSRLFHIPFCDRSFSWIYSSLCMQERKQFGETNIPGRKFPQELPWNSQTTYLTKVIVCAWIVGIQALRVLKHCSRDSSVGIVRSLWTGQTRNWGSICDRAKGFLS